MVQLKIFYIFADPARNSYTTSQTFTNYLSSHNDSSVDHEILWILVGSKGGQTRARILEMLSEKPMNANQIAETLGLNYHTITYNMDVLIKNKLVVVEGPRYGQVYYPSRIVTSNINAFKKIIEGATKERNKENNSV